MSKCEFITIPICETKINDVNLVWILTDPYKKIVRLDVAMDKVVEVDVLDVWNLRVEDECVTKDWRNNPVPSSVPV